MLNDHVQRTEQEMTTTLQSVSDYASQPSLLRDFVPICQSKQKTNDSIIILSFEPQKIAICVQKRGEREARTISGVRNDCIIVMASSIPSSSPRRCSAICRYSTQNVPQARFYQS